MEEAEEENEEEEEDEEEEEEKTKYLHSCRNFDHSYTA
jgi:hypothetical protein